MSQTTMFSIDDEAPEIPSTTGATAPARRETAKDRARREWDEIRAAAVAILVENRPILEAFRARLAALFDAMRADTAEPFARRPNISLRLIVAGDPPAKLIVLPNVRHDAGGGYLVPARQTVELMEQKNLTVQGQDAAQLRRKLTVPLDPDSENPPRLGTIYRSAPDDARRIIATIRDYLEQPAATLARGSDHCCICGRGLSDELSRSRGIGPECVRSKTNIVAILLEPGETLVRGFLEAEHNPSK